MTTPPPADIEAIRKRQDLRTRGMPEHEWSEAVKDCAVLLSLPAARGGGAKREELVVCASCGFQNIHLVASTERDGVEALRK